MPSGVFPRTRRPASERFWEKVQKGDGCWVWMGALIKGYGAFQQETTRTVRAHRFSYEEANGPIPSGLQICHSCDNPRCVRPDHMRVGTALDNSRDKWSRGRGSRAPQGLCKVNAAKTHCKRGHPLAGENLRVNKSGERVCRICRNAYALRRYYAKRGEITSM
jgi:hypothetical protein